MTTKETYTIGTLDNEYKEYFERVNPGYTCTGETLCIGYETTDADGVTSKGSTTYAIMRGPITRYQMVRDCGDHYIHAVWSGYVRIDKGSLKVTRDVDDN